MIWVVPGRAQAACARESAVRRSAAQRRIAAPELWRAGVARHANRVVSRCAAHSGSGRFAGRAHWKVYLPVMGLAFVMMVPAIIAAEKRGKMKAVMVGAIGLILIGQLLLGVAPHTLWAVAAILFVYFLGFNVLEASQPSLVSKLAPGTRKGAAAGVYNTTQSIGLAIGRGDRRLAVESRWAERCVFRVLGVGVLHG